MIPWGRGAWGVGRGRDAGRIRPLPPAPCPLPLLLVLLVMTGCSALTHIQRHVPTTAEVAASTDHLDDGYVDRVGVLHVHTTYSHDAHGTFEDAVRVANGQRLDYLIITDHNTLGALRDGKQGWHGATLVLVGMEVSTRSGHYLAFNVSQEINFRKLTTQEIIDEVNRQGGFGFIAHPYFKRGRWRDWTVTGITGIEAYNAAHDTLDENRLRLALWTLTAPAEPFYYSILDRPYDPLAKWDELIRQRGRMVGIGATDAHEFHVLGLKFAPYEVMFQLVRTHLLTGPGTLTAEQVYGALQKGHAYLAIELLAEAKGFRFMATRGNAVVGIMGDAVPLSSELQLSISLPAPAEVTLMKDGRPLATITGQMWKIPVTAPGAYRVEAMRHGKPWIIANPIYITPAVGVVDSPQP